MNMTRIAGLMAGTTLMVLASPVAEGQASDVRSYDLPAQDLGTALRQVSAASGRPVVVATDLVSGLRAPALKGRFTADAAVAELLRETGLHAVSVAGTLVVQRLGDDTGAGGNAAEGDVLVTGSRIRGHGPVGSAVTMIDRKAIEESGYATTQQIAQSIPQNFGGGLNEATAGGGTLGQNTGANSARGSSLNLRGLGPTSTLVLLNGDRPPLAGFAGAFADISMIPASAVERIEIVADGTSAIYGSDAVAGVVNIVPRLSFRGAETSARIGSADGDGLEIQASQLLGTGWSGGHAMIAYEYYRRDRLRAADRRFATEDLRPFGGVDHRSDYASPGTIIAGGQSYAIPAGQNGIGLNPASLVPGTVNPGDNWAGADILPRQDRHSLFAAASQELGAVRLYAQGLLSIRTFRQALRPGFDTQRTVPVTNPFYVDPIGTHQPVAVRYSFRRDLGNETARGIASAYGGTAGIEATLGDWSIDGHGTIGRQYERSTTTNRVNSARLAAALADSNPATAYNLFGDGPSTNPATIDRVRGSYENANTGSMWSATLRAEGPLLSLPAGRVRLAAGGEYREERYVDRGGIIDTATLTPEFLPGLVLNGPRRVRAGFAELLVPVFGGGFTMPGFRRLDLSAAVRGEHYSDFGATTNPKIGIAWEPLAGVTLRGSYGKSFRAPSFSDLRQDPGSQLIFSYTIPDPQAASGQSNVIVLRGNDPALRPERATTWTIGADLTARFLPGFRASLTWFNIDYRDRIASPSAQLFNFLVNRSTYAGITEASPSPARVAELYASPIFVNFLNIPQTAPFAAVVDARLQNLSVVRQSGLDLDIDYGVPLGGGRAEIGAAATYIFHIDQALTDDAPATDVVGILGNPVDLKLRGHLSWTSASNGVALYLNYVDSYENRTNAAAEPVASWTTVDLQLSHRFGDGAGPLRGIRVALNASNLFDRDPPYAAYFIGTATAGYDPENASPLGRVVSLQVTKSW